MNMQTELLPKTGLAGLKQHWRSDLFSGFLVFLIALPLCLGIAIASGFPPSAGIITAIVGGLLVSRINGSFVTINGPAAGLIVVVYSAVQTLGVGDNIAGYRYTLAAIVLASILQILMGTFKAGRFSTYFPAAVVHGMLAAIGIIIIAKQSHIMFGATPEPGSIIATIAQIPYSIIHPTPLIAFIGLSGMAILLLWPRVKNPSWKLIPAPIILLFTGILFAQIFSIQNHSDGQFLVPLPDDLMSSFYFPDFAKFMTFDFWVAVFSICLVGSLESLLSAKAVDKLDPYKRSSNLDRDLTAIGIGNFVCGLLGGLPMIAEIVRSSANVNNAAKTSWANFFHGLILLLFVIFFPEFIQNIPLATLAVLLVYTGFRLVSPQTFRDIMKIGYEQLFLFIVTIVAVIATNLLLGVAIGIIAKFALHIMRGVWLENLFKIHFSMQNKDHDTIVVKLYGSALFSNFLPLQNALAKLPLGKTISFNFTDGYLIDHTVMDLLHEFSTHYTEQGGHCQQVGQPLEKFSDHALAARVMTRDDRKNKWL